MKRRSWVRGQAAIDDGNLCSPMGQGKSGGPADASAATGDKGDGFTAAWILGNVAHAQPPSVAPHRPQWVNPSGRSRTPQAAQERSGAPQGVSLAPPEAAAARSFA